MGNSQELVDELCAWLDSEGYTGTEPPKIHGSNTLLITVMLRKEPRMSGLSYGKTGALEAEG